MLSLILAGLCLFVAYVTFFKKNSHKGQPLPPTCGFSLPLIGHLHLLWGKEDPTDSILEIAQKAGKISRFDIAFVTNYIITDPDLTLEATKTDALDARPLKDFESQALVRGGRNPDGSLPGIGFADGPAWKEQRKFAFQQLIHSGFGDSNSLEDVVHLECEEIIKTFKETKGKPTKIIGNTFALNSLNIVWHFVTGKAPTEVTNVMVNSVNEFFRVNAPGFLNSLQLYFPIITKLFAALGFENLLSVKQILDNIVVKEIDHHKSTFQKDNITNFIDAYLAKAAENRANSSFTGENGMLNLRNSLFDLFLAGMDTVATTLSWSVMFMAKYPDKVAKAQEEISRIIGDERPSLSHRPLTPYVEAFVLEVQRIGSLVPMVARCATRDVMIGGYMVPKGANVFYSVKNFTCNPEYFENPKEFRPERFIDAKGKFIKDDRVITFGLGKRRCPGESMARMELYLLITTILQGFNIKPARIAPHDMEIKHQLGIVKQPNAAELIFMPRNI